MNRHVEILEQRVQPFAVDRRLGEIGGERILVHDHQEQEEHLHARDDRDDIRNQLALALPVRVDRAGSKNRQQRDPEHDGAVEPTPVGGDLVEQRLGRVRVVVDVDDGIVFGDEGVDNDRRRQQHERRDDVEGADAALNQPGGASTRAGHRDGSSIAARDERRQECEVPQRCHGVDLDS